jgi:hypothetical protein
VIEEIKSNKKLEDLRIIVDNALDAAEKIRELFDGLVLMTDHRTENLEKRKKIENLVREYSFQEQKTANPFMLIAMKLKEAEIIGKCEGSVNEETLKNIINEINKERENFVNSKSFGEIRKVKAEEEKVIEDGEQQEGKDNKKQVNNEQSGNSTQAPTPTIENRTIKNARKTNKASKREGKKNSKKGRASKNNRKKVRVRARKKRSAARK